MEGSEILLLFRNGAERSGTERSGAERNGTTPFWGLGLGRTRTGSFVVLLIETQWREEICSPG